MDRCVGCGKVIRRITLIIGLLFSPAVLAAAGELDRSRYIPPDELKPGMKGFGRTVMSGNKIETFQLEVLGIMRNSYSPKQDVILVRCSGLNLEHSGIIRGMSGSPCYVWNESGEPRMFGALAYGWSFNKDPVCGIQPITQMIDIPKVRSPGSQAKNPQNNKLLSSAGTTSAPAGGKGTSLGKIVARSFSEPISLPSRFSLFNNDISASGVRRERASDISGQLRPLEIPVAIPGRLAGETMSYLQKHMKRCGFMPVVAGQADAATLADARDVKIEPGSVLCIRLMGGDLTAQAIGTCTEVIGNRVLGFGHDLYGEGSVELRLATG